jgi:hypothetical protein
VETAQGDEAEGIWNLLMCLPTNLQIQERILNNDNLEDLLGGEVAPAGSAISSGNLYVVLYCL